MARAVEFYERFVVVVFESDDLEGERARALSIGATGATGIVGIDLAAPYRFFHFLDPEGNLVKVGRHGP